ncbi:hypothetical protein B0T26DRAFT_314554 [Lasiosphaeria miniovina]|uniref:Uncharacterized protein n=1 Tax=Lasiosphaeria miniovina TaxID=1954250 RepID=A0AA40ALR0_9PEZI|nr:uncharacterized protein B0T26DRAFT_314554 [Lasiosphaeria miniovina]KAK0718134.1 hypothetical protein B0T26DRAFT_314554 [Lasiosphaeria miniovina]
MPVLQTTAYVQFSRLYGAMQGKVCLQIDSLNSACLSPQVNTSSRTGGAKNRRGGLPHGKMTAVVAKETGDGGDRVFSWVPSTVFQFWVYGIHSPVPLGS